MSRLGLLSFLIGAFLCLAASNEHPNTNETVWDVLRQELSLNHQISEPEVQKQIRWLVSHPGYLQELAHAEPYIYHIVTEIKKRHLPGELALIPMIESTFDPFAYSGAGAAGLWQLMPNTGSELGLKQDWWYDDRRSIGPSTDAALNYLAYLVKFFHGDWILAIAAYDAGEGSVSRSIKKSKQNRKKNIQFWSLPLPRETKAYVPRLLALAEIIKYPKHYHVTLPEIPHAPYFLEVNVGSPIDLNHAAKLAEISYRDLIKLNPGHNRQATAPNQPFKLLIPTKKVAIFSKNLSKIPKEKRVSWKMIHVLKKDTLESLARRYFTTPKLIAEFNQLKNKRLKPGQKLLMPDLHELPKGNTPKKMSEPSIKNYKVIHIVQVGENLEMIEKKYQVKKQKILAWNHLNTATLHPGTPLTLWKAETKRS